MNNMQAHIAQMYPGLAKGWELGKQKRKKENTYRCLQCGKEFYRTGTDRTRAKFCSLKCKREWWTGRPSPTKGKLRKRKGIYKKCEVCGKEFYVIPSETNRAKYCSANCRDKANKNRLKARLKEKTLLEGYVYIFVPEHPFKNCQQRVAEHRLVMEKILGRYLLSTEDVHHLNGIKTDNRPENLMVVSHNKHGEEIECPYCHRKFIRK